jgi:hypothetical protein
MCFAFFVEFLLYNTNDGNILFFFIHWHGRRDDEVLHGQISVDLVHKQAFFSISLINKRCMVMSME